MSVSRLKTWAAGEVLTASDLNAEFNNITSNGEDLGSPRSKAFDMNGQNLIIDADGDSYLFESSDDVLGLRLQGVDLFYFDGDVASPVNALTFVASATGTAAYVIASGTDTNIDVQVRSKGSGDVILADDSGNEIVIAADIASAVNEITISNAATGNNPSIAVTGDDDNINLELTAKGTGNVTVGGVIVESFASGTVMIFRQTSAPTGWTKGSTYNDVVLRAVTGTPSSGGSWTISGLSTTGGDEGTTRQTGTGATFDINLDGHVHPVASDASWRPAYVDVIEASKD